MQNYLHIISFDIPFPANYGGAIDVFHKLRCLHKQGINIILHCFEYGDRKPSPQLDDLCYKVHYYKRNTSVINHFSILPYNVKSRINKELKQNLLKDNYPILFEVLHTCYLMNDLDLKNRFKIYRHSNIEHDYFYELAKAEKNLLKRIYFNIEALKLKVFEKQVTHANCILSVSKTDLEYFKKNYSSVASYYLPSFNEFDTLNVKEGLGDYILYHGNLAVSENHNAAIWLINNVFNKIKYSVIIAGLNPPVFLIELIKEHKNITLIQNCSTQTMNDLIANAQIHCLYTSQETGLKLKLLNVLYSGRYILANSKMFAGTNFDTMCEVCNTPKEFIDNIDSLMNKPINNDYLKMREELLHEISNKEKTEILVRLLAKISVK